MSYRITADQHALAARRDGLPPQYIVSVYALPTITTARTNPTFGLSRAEYDRIMMDIECEAVSSDAPGYPYPTLFTRSILFPETLDF